MDMTYYSGEALLEKVTPQEVIDELQAMGDRASQDRWRIGQLTNVLKSEVDRRLLPISVMNIYDKVSEWLNHEYSARTVRYFSDISAFFTPFPGEQYKELPFTHFELAKIYGERWREVLDLSLELREQNDGRPPSREKLDAIVSKRLYDYISDKVHDEYVPPPDEYYQDEFEAAESTQSNPDNAHDNAAVSWAGMGILLQLLKVGIFVNEHIMLIPIGADRRKHLSEVLNELVLLLEDIRESVKVSNSVDLF